jgi:ligand-binding SRPBCC domain-containing protein
VDVRHVVRDPGSKVMATPGGLPVARSYAFTVVSHLRAPPERVWAHAHDFTGVNAELWPLAEMTYPAGMARLVPGVVPLGRPAFRSWILLFGLVPIDFDDITLVELHPGQGFSEVSRMFSVREWRHRRTLTPEEEGCVLKDEVAFVPRWGWTGPLLKGAYHLTFEHRHRCLRRLFKAAKERSD